MGHHISGLVSDFSLLKEFADSHKLHRPATLVGNLAFLPLDAEHLDSLFPDQGGFDPAMPLLSAALKKCVSELSTRSSIAYIETEYFGGDGTQGATVYRDGLCIMPPVTEESGPISKAMVLLGVVKDSTHFDEFEAAGLGRNRSNESWIDETS